MEYSGLRLSTNIEDRRNEWPWYDRLAYQVGLTGPIDRQMNARNALNAREQFENMSGSQPPLPQPAGPLSSQAGFWDIPLPVSNFDDRFRGTTQERLVRAMMNK
jgi:hypothetical protein